MPILIEITLIQTYEPPDELIIPRKTIVTASITSAGNNCMTILPDGFCGAVGGSKISILSFGILDLILVFLLNLG